MKKSAKISTIGVLLILITLVPQPSSCAAHLTIDRGCGATYYLNESILINFMVTGDPGDSITVTLNDQLADGTVKTIFSDKSILPNTDYYATGVIGPPCGTETLVLEWCVFSEGLGAVGAETCSFCVASSGGVGYEGNKGGETTLYIKSNISNFEVWWDGIYNHTTPYDYAILYDVPSGTHTITLKKSGCSDASKTVTIVEGVQNTMTINMNCDSGGSSSRGEADTDGDGVPDNQDSCYNPECNIVDSQGCPRDSDRDGVNDCEDFCPTENGPFSNDGCPMGDRDDDGVTDDEDSCYNPDCSIVDSQGCPKDTDGDGINDCDDDCPYTYGEQEDHGCPEEDSDVDGVTDDRDNCYNPGCTLVDSKGCPWDSDNDGLNDCEDNCPNQSGSRSNNGCPSLQSSTSLFDTVITFIKFLFALLLLIAVLGIAFLMWNRKQKKKPVSTGTPPYDDTRIY